MKNKKRTCIPRPFCFLNALSVLQRSAAQMPGKMAAEVAGAAKAAALRNLRHTQQTTSTATPWQWTAAGWPAKQNKVSSLSSFSRPLVSFHLQGGIFYFII